MAAVTAGPGVTDAVTAVANAQRGGEPMILLGGQGPSFAREMGSLQEMDHVRLMRSITKWSATVPETRRIPDYLAIAFRKATTGVPGPVFLELPLDVLMGMEDPTGLNWPGAYRTEAVAGGDPTYLQRAADLLAQAERPIAIVGSQWWWSPYRDTIGEFVTRFDLPTFLNGGARGALPPEHPHFFRQCRSKALAGELLRNTKRTWPSSKASSKKRTVPRSHKNACKHSSISSVYLGCCVATCPA